MGQSAWNPQQYERFRTQRAQPFFDLLKLVQPRPDMRILDLGCGTGELTRVLHDTLQARATLGIDRSETMLAKSAQFVGGGVNFQLADVTTFRPEGCHDLVFSNAALHWVPEHPALLQRLTGWLGPNGQLAVQVPANHDHPTHVVALEVAAEAPFCDALGGYVRTYNVLAPEAYATLLESLGYRAQHVHLRVYGHHLASRADVVEWVKGTLLTDYQQRLPADLFERFLERYRRRLLPMLDDARPYFYPFKRILFWASRATLSTDA